MLWEDWQQSFALRPSAARGRTPSMHALDDERIVEQIRRSQQRHGAATRRRMIAEVRQAKGCAVNEKRVARVMREYGLQSHKRRTFRWSRPIPSKLPGGAERAADRAAPLVAEERLVELLADWSPTFPGYHLYYASRRQTSPALALVVEALGHRG